MRIVLSSTLTISLILVLSSNLAAWAQYKIGDRVKIGQEYGTVIEMGPPMFDGGNQIKVHLDRFGDAFPNTGVTYDPKRSQVQPAGAGDPKGGGGGGAGGGFGGGTAGGGGFGGGGGAGGGGQQAHTMPVGQPTPFGGGGTAGGGGMGGIGAAVNAAKNFLKGQRVFIGNLNEWGTVMGLGRGPNLVRVNLDRFHNGTSFVDFDPIASRVATAGTPGAPADPGTGNGGTGGPGGTGAGGGKTPGPGGDVQVPKGAPANDETFKNVIRSKFPQPGWGDTETLDFQTFSTSGPMPHVVRYEGHLDMETIMGGPGRTVQAYKVHTKYVQTTHYKDPQADDKYNVKEGDYWIYKDQNGFWVAEGENVQVGPTQYIHK